MIRWCFVALAAISISCGGGGFKQGYPLTSEIATGIPADTVALAGGRMDLLLESPAFARLQQMLPAGGLDGVAKEFGLDPRKEIKEFVVAYNGREPLMLASGSFRAADVLAKVASTAGAGRSEYKGKPMVTRGTAGIAALSSTVLAAGPVNRLHECSDRLSQSAKLDERWAASLRTLPAQTQLWFLSTGGSTLNLPPGSNLGNIDKILASVDRLAVWADLSKSLHLTASAATRDAASAKQLHTQLRGLIGIGRLSTPDDKPELLKLYDGIQTKLEENKIDVEIDVPTASLEVLLPKR